MELKYLAPYLPYKLKIRCGEISHPTLTCSNTNEFEIAIKEVFINSSYKPILHPLSDLTKEIEVNGEKFVPLIELFNIETKMDWSNEIKTDNGLNEWWIRLKGEGKSFYFGYNSEMGFYSMNKFSDKEFVRNQKELWEKLFQWHFDVFGLIEKELAIDINKLKK